MLERSPLGWLEWLTYRAVALDTPENGATLDLVHDRLTQATRTERAPTTINTILIRLREKGWVRTEFDVRKKAFHFPSVPYEEALQDLVRFFLEQHQLRNDRDTAIVRSVFDEL